MLKLGELGDKLAAHPIFLVAFNVALIALLLLIGIDAANIFISIITAEIVLLTAGANRRNSIAVHAKLDELIKTQPDARDDLLHLEEAAEKEIIERRL